MAKHGRGRHGQRNKNSGSARCAQSALRPVQLTLARASSDGQDQSSACWRPPRPCIKKGTLQKGCLLINTLATTSSPARLTPGNCEVLCLYFKGHCQSPSPEQAHSFLLCAQKQTAPTAYSAFGRVQLTLACGYSDGRGQSSACWRPACSCTSKGTLQKRCLQAYTLATTSSPTRLTPFTCEALCLYFESHCQTLSPKQNRGFLVCEQNQAMPSRVNVRS